jgi:thiol-disulfide isomerase/thioredoxin
MDPEPGKNRHSPWAWMALGLAAMVIVAVVAVFLAKGGDSGTATASEGAGSAPAGQATPAGDTAAAEIPQAAALALGQVRKQSEEPIYDQGKPSVFFMGAEWCPFCASERWALVEATSRFGTWTGLGELRSRPGQANLPSLPTYDLTGATYKSDLIALRHVEVATVDGDPLQRVGPFEEGLVNEYDKGGSIPFLFAGGPGGRYTVDLAYSPSLLEGQSFASLRQDVAAGAPTEAVAAISGEADAITALICKLDGQEPASVCGQPGIEAIGGEIE